MNDHQEGQDHTQGHEDHAQAEKEAGIIHSLFFFALSGVPNALEGTQSKRMFESNICFH